ncbi:MULTISPECIES: tripartite tricarboxylate transporter TctB family protein [Rhizobium/Agrobacterium group]|uniref:C4-dicarboxylate ABC transporter n=1 Tax=Agrobacterium tumefaciens TaxID=358 RepID=A0A0D0KSW1_AGRTU|nr:MULTISPECIES: tripartite tricarboxylate transporter TctB family protein [Rhizobium]KIQ02936.1 C4-dicarboxylate ABC transporter [Agrobacterium tumefaciens]MBD8686632.1 tripartite tricarboxylate transporter TctB family protein [Rhizobium sp. CFBP 13644]MBD8691566.1 tripartite tricarboxylate transporter TctB family protein [Rhizobium sp. CFBP 13717]MCI9864600.1 tripartite tricarboxylate transporter TctB family protein [Rhizobium skierniewicense]
MSQGSTPSHPSKRRPDWAAFAIAVFLVIVAAVIFWDSARLASVTGYSPVGPATVPYAIAFCLIGLAIWTAIEAWRNDFPARDKQEMGPVFWVIAGLAAQMLLLNVAGFSIATGLLFAFTARAFGKRKLWFSIPIGIVFSFVIWVIFAQLLQLSLPAGPLERLFF